MKPKFRIIFKPTFIIFFPMDLGSLEFMLNRLDIIKASLPDDVYLALEVYKNQSL